MSVKTTFFAMFIFVQILSLTVTSIPADAGVFSSTVAKVSARKAAQRVAVKEAADRAAAKEVMERAAIEKVVIKKAEAKLAVRQYEKGMVSEQKKNKAIWAWDKARDKALPVKPLENPKTVRRYTSIKQAKIEKANGIAPDTHMTAKEVGPGRPLSTTTAKDRYGLAKEPGAWMTVTIPKGQPVRQGKVINGLPGFGEITSTKCIPPENIVGIHPMH